MMNAETALQAAFEPTHEWYRIAVFPKEEGGDGQTCEVDEMAMPAKFWRVRVSAGANSVGEPMPAYSLSTGSGPASRELALMAAKAISDGMFGLDFPAAAILGRLGGQAKSPRKAAAVRENGKLGGRVADPARKARRQAHSESSLYRQGAGWIVSTWDERYSLHTLSHEQPYAIARQALADWRDRRTAELLS